MKVIETFTPEPAIASETEATDYYRSAQDHLADELRKLNALLQMQVARFRSRHASRTGDAFGGLCITEQEVDEILYREGSSPAEDDQSWQALLPRVEQLRTRIAHNVAASLERGVFLPLAHLSYLLQLTPFESDALLTCLAPELDRTYERLYAYLQDDVTQTHATGQLLLDLLCQTETERMNARLSLSAQAPLCKYALLSAADNSQCHQRLLARRLVLDERLVNFLLGVNLVDARLDACSRLISPEADWSAVVLRQEKKARLRYLAHSYLTSPTGTKLLLSFSGPEGSGKKLVAEALCHEIGLPCLVVDIRTLLQIEMPAEQAIALVFREAFLLPAAIYLEHVDRLLTEAPQDLYYQTVIINAIRECSFVTFAAGERAWNPVAVFPRQTVAQMTFPRPDYSQRRQLWKMALRSVAVPQDVELEVDSLANTFRLTGGQIRNAARAAQQLNATRPSPSSGVTLDDLYQSCRAQSNHNLVELARKIDPLYRWNDLVLPPDTLEQLKEIGQWVVSRWKVYTEWGFERKMSLGKGVNALFSGPSGTGKTMAAEILAYELNLDLYKIDLSCVVSKYIGETEKNLAKIFHEAETSNGILFFDEADALFGKRSEVKDAHDRYANIEIGYLLQKMEEYTGVVILATNMKNNMDEAFVRRMHFMIEFPFPEEASRLRIWQQVFPDDTLVDQEVDFPFLARKFKLSGGNIRNIALAAAFYAAHDGQVVTMPHLILATKREFQKLGKICVKADFDRYYQLIQQQVELHDERL